MNPKASAWLDRLIKERQALISGGTLKKELKQFGDEFPNDCDDPHYDFLDHVDLYDRAVKAGLKDPQYYVDLANQFQKIERSTPELAFYIPNYALLCVRNAGAPHDEVIPNIFQQAVEAARDLNEVERAEALGHLYYNMARFLLAKQVRVDEALALWQDAATHRLTFLKHLRDANETQERLLAAAQQVWKMRGDFEKFFPEKNIGMCGVSAKTITELEQEFGDEVKLFSAKT